MSSEFEASYAGLLGNFTYDKRYWEISNDFNRVDDNILDFIRQEGITEYLHYIGPIENGCIIDDIPNTNIYCLTFKDCKNLEVIPKNKYRHGFVILIAPFLYCNIRDMRNYYTFTIGSTRYRATNVYAGCTLFQCDDISTRHRIETNLIIEQLTGLALEELKAKYSDKAGTGFPDYRSIISVVDLVQKYPEDIKQNVAGSFKQMVTIMRDKSIDIRYLKEFYTECLSSGSNILRIDVTFHSTSCISFSCCNLQLVYQGDVVNVEAVKDTTVDEVLLMFKVQGSDLRRQFIRRHKQGDIHLSKQNNTLYVEEDSILDGHIFIDDVNSEIRIIGTGHNKRNKLIINGTSLNPCIGIQVHDNMSYGRWCPGVGNLKRLVLENVNVILNSRVSDFSIGSYGTNDKVRVILGNSSLKCPEMTGFRVMVKSGAEGLEGSTKRYAAAVYKLVDKALCLIESGATKHELKVLDPIEYSQRNDVVTYYTSEELSRGCKVSGLINDLLATYVAENMCKALLECEMNKDQKEGTKSYICHVDSLIWEEDENIPEGYSRYSGYKIVVAGYTKHKFKPMVRKVLGYINIPDVSCSFEEFKALYEEIQQKITGYESEQKSKDSTICPYCGAKLGPLGKCLDFMCKGSD